MNNNALVDLPDQMGNKLQNCDSVTTIYKPAVEKESNCSNRLSSSSEEGKTRLKGAEGSPTGESEIIDDLIN